MPEEANSARVLFVCLGNICRSPTAQGVFESLAKQAGMANVQADSCGTGDWHVGSAPDSRTTDAAAARGYAIAHLRARQLQSDDFDRFDYILAMDKANLHDVQTMSPRDCRSHVGLFMDFARDRSPAEVPDPYYGGNKGFDQVLNLVEAASAGLILTLKARR
jgi:protein-tyrosine phosphatase